MYEAYVKREQADKAALERNAYITGLIANTNLDDGKQTKQRALENVDIDYQNTLRSIYNVITGEEIDLKEDPFFKAIKPPGQETWRQEATESDRTTENPEIDIDQGG